MRLNEEQKKQVRLQVAAHRHSKYVTDIHLSSRVVLKDFSVFPKVLRPEVMSAVYLARWLYDNNELYANKTVIDMGCGSGIQGIIAGLYGASFVVFSDVAYSAVLNTKENIYKYNLEYKSVVLHGDLFEHVSTKADNIIFNHPFFSDGSMEEQLNMPASMLDRGQLIHRFLADAKNFLLPGGKIIMPYFHLAGAVNDPGVQSLKHGYRVERRWHEKVTTGLQKGWHSIYIMSL